MKELNEKQDESWELDTFFGRKFEKYVAPVIDKLVINSLELFSKLIDPNSNNSDKEKQ